MTEDGRPPLTILLRLRLTSTERSSVLRHPSPITRKSTFVSSLGTPRSSQPIMP